MGTFVRRSGQITADMSFTNKALQAMGNFAIQFNKNRWVILRCKYCYFDSQLHSC